MYDDIQKTFSFWTQANRGHKPFKWDYVVIYHMNEMWGAREDELYSQVDEFGYSAWWT
mgnify:CR=1 FL=1